MGSLDIRASYLAVRMISCIPAVLGRSSTVSYGVWLLRQSFKGISHLQCLLALTVPMAIVEH